MPEKGNLFPFPGLLEEFHPTLWEEEDESLEEFEEDTFDPDWDYEIYKAAA